MTVSKCVCFVKRFQVHPLNAILGPLHRLHPGRHRDCGLSRALFRSVRLDKTVCAPRHTGKLLFGFLCCGIFCHHNCRTHVVWLRHSQKTANADRRRAKQISRDVSHGFAHNSKGGRQEFVQRIFCQYPKRSSWRSHAIFVRLLHHGLVGSRAFKSR